MSKIKYSEVRKPKHTARKVILSFLVITTLFVGSIFTAYGFTADWKSLSAVGFKNYITELYNPAVPPIEDLSGEVLTLTGQLATANSEITELDQQLLSYTNQILSLENDLDILQEAKTGLEDDLETVQQEKTALEETITANNAAILLLQQEAIIDQTAIDNLLIENEGLGEQLTAIETVLTATQANLTGVNEELATANNAISLLQENVLILQTQKAELEVFTQHVTSVLNDPQIGGGLSFDEFVSYVADLESFLIHLSDVSNQKTIIITDLNNIITDLNATIVSLNQQISDLQVQLDALQPQAEQTTLLIELYDVTSESMMPTYTAEAPAFITSAELRVRSDLTFDYLEQTITFRIGLEDTFAGTYFFTDPLIVINNVTFEKNGIDEQIGWIEQVVWENMATITISHNGTVEEVINLSGEFNTFIESVLPNFETEVINTTPMITNGGFVPFSSSVQTTINNLPVLLEMIWENWETA